MEHFQNNSLSSDEIAQIHQLSYLTITAIGDITPLLLLIDNDESPTNEQSQQIEIIKVELFVIFPLI